MAKKLLILSLYSIYSTFKNMVIYDLYVFVV